MVMSLKCAVDALIHTTPMRNSSDLGLAFILISVLPFFIILACNVLIIRALVKTRWPQKTTIALIVVRQSSRNTIAESLKSFRQPTLMCLSASIAFVKSALTPSIVLTIGRVRWSQDPHREAYYMARAFTHQLACLNHAINFFLYCFSGQRFRRELLLMLCCRKVVKMNGRSSRSVSSFASSRQPMSPVECRLLQLSPIAATDSNQTDDDKVWKRREDVSELNL